MLAELSQGRSCGQTARGGRGTVCRVEFSYPDAAAVKTSPVRKPWIGIWIDALIDRD